MNRHRVLGAQGGLVPNLLIDLGGGIHPPGILDEQPQDAVLAGGELHRLAVHGDAFVHVVQLNASQNIPVRLFDPCAQHGIAPELGPHPGQHLHGVEGLCDIVVGTHVEAVDLVGALTFGGQQDDGDVGGLPQLGGDGDAVHLRHHDVQQDQLNVVVFDGFQGLLSRIGLKEAVILLRGQINFKSSDDVPVIIADQNVIHGCSQTDFS